MYAHLPRLCEGVAVAEVTKSDKGLVALYARVKVKKP